MKQGERERKKEIYIHTHTHVLSDVVSLNAKGKEASRFIPV